MRPEYLEDFKLIMQMINDNHPCPLFNTSKEELDNFIQEKIKSSNIQNNYDFFYFASSVLKLINDSHTAIRFNKGFLPIEIKNIDGKYIITNASDEYEKYILSEIKCINEKPLNIIISEMKNVISYSVDEWLKNMIELRLTDKAMLLSLPSIDSYSDKLAFEFYNTDEKCEFIVNKDYEMTKLYKKNYTYEHNQNANALILKYSSCKDKEKMIEFINRITNYSNDNNINNFIVDLRDNNGGDSQVIKPLIAFLDDQNKNIVTLVNEGVFSSGRMAALELKNIRSTSIGTNIGTSLNAFGDCANIELPNSKMKFSCSTQYFYLNTNTNKINSVTGKENFAKFANETTNEKNLNKQIFTVDYQVERPLEDYVNNVDSQMEFAINYISNKSNLKK